MVLNIKKLHKVNCLNAHKKKNQSREGLWIPNTSEFYDVGEICLTSPRTTLTVAVKKLSSDITQIFAEHCPMSCANIQAWSYSRCMLLVQLSVLLWCIMSSHAHGLFSIFVIRVSKYLTYVSPKFNILQLFKILRWGKKYRRINENLADPQQSAIFCNDTKNNFWGRKSDNDNPKRQKTT